MTWKSKAASVNLRAAFHGFTEEGYKKDKMLQAM